MKNNEPSALESATRALRGFDPVPTDDSRQDVWARLRTPSSPLGWRPKLIPIAAAAAVLVVTVVGLSSSRRTEPEAKAPGRGRVLVETDGIVLEDGSRVVTGSILTTHGPAEIRSARILVFTEAGTRLRLIDIPPEPPRLEILTGTAEVALTPTELTNVVVHGRNLRLLGTRVEVQTRPERSELIARASDLRIELQNRSETLAPGQSMTLKAKTQALPPAVSPSAATSDPASSAAKTQAPAAASKASETPKPTSSHLLPRLPTAEEQLDQAHRVAASDATQAETLAREVLGRMPSPKMEARALAILADARRRNGAKAEATALYRQVAEHKSGGPFAEEALYQAAQLLLEMKRHKEALGVLAEAQTRFEAGPLAPERHALAAQVYDAAGDRARARAALIEAKTRAERAGDRASAARFTERLDAIGEKE